MKSTKILLVVILFLGSIVFVSPVNASDEIIYFPIVEPLDLCIDGSVSPLTLTASSEFDYITGLLFVLIWEENSVDYDHFGNHTSSLTNGTLIYYNNSQIFESIVSIGSFTSLSYDMQILEDDKDPVENYLFAPVDFTNFMEDGLDVRSRNLQFIVQDNNSAYCNSFIVQVHGVRGIYSPDKTTPPPNLLADIQDFAVGFMSYPLWWLAILIPAIGIIWLIRK